MELSLPPNLVRASAEIDIAAHERGVWTVIADIAAWPTWNPAVRQATFDDQLDVDSRFRYSTPFGSMTCRITRADAPRELAWTGRVLTVRRRHAWRIEPRSDGVHVTTEATMSGLSVRFLRARLRERLQGELDALVQLLKLEAEARVAEEREAARLTATREGEST